MMVWTRPVWMRAVLSAWVATSPLSACAPRAFPTSLPKASAASREADAAPEAPLGAMLQADPPLPGEPTDRWQGLEEPPSLTKGGAGGQEGAPAHPAGDRPPGGQEGGQEHGH
jgi:hypothetical protein